MIYIKKMNIISHNKLTVIILSCFILGSCIPSMNGDESDKEKKILDKEQQDKKSFQRLSSKDKELFISNLIQHKWNQLIKSGNYKNDLKISLKRESVVKLKQNLKKLFLENSILDSLHKISSTEVWDNISDAKDCLKEKEINFHLKVVNLKTGDTLAFSSFINGSRCVILIEGYLVSDVLFFENINCLPITNQLEQYPGIDYQQAINLAYVEYLIAASDQRNFYGRRNMCSLDLWNSGLLNKHQVGEKILPEFMLLKKGHQNNWIMKKEFSI